MRGASRRDCTDYRPLKEGRWLPKDRCSRASIDSMVQKERDRHAWTSQRVLRMVRLSKGSPRYLEIPSCDKDAGPVPASIPLSLGTSVAGADSSSRTNEKLAPLSQHFHIFFNKHVTLTSLLLRSMFYLLLESLNLI